MLVIWGTTQRRKGRRSVQAGAGIEAITARRSYDMLVYIAGGYRRLRPRRPQRTAQARLDRAALSRGESGLAERVLCASTARGPSRDDAGRHAAAAT